MTPLLDSFWRAAAYCLHPRVIWLSFLPLLICGGLAGLLGYFFWEDALAGLRATLQSWHLLEALLGWLDSIGAAGLRVVIAPLIVVALAIPVLIVFSLLVVALLMTPAVVSLVAQRRFAKLERRRGASFSASATWSLGCTLAALAALVVSIPFWFVPPLVLLLPPLIWGWLTYRVLSFDALAEHASADERRALMREHRLPLIAMGVVTGYLGAAPSLLWAASAALLIFAPVLVVAAVWIYTLVFAFSTLWFTHYLLAALEVLRSRIQRDADASPSTPVVASSPATLSLPRS
ncbi:MAG: EI24 domain-containing protein [Burkholderiaceae bacterium]